MSHVFIRSGLDHIDSTYASLSGTPEAKYAELVKHRNFDEKELLALLDQLKPVCPELHWHLDRLKGQHQTAPDFRSTEDVDPIVVYNAEGKR
ncbi:hypothetical protein N7470_006602 [Penicillium chermesinum]|nr:hypothetical protein N7470_006602 [Penicillium chermesinum]